MDDTAIERRRTGWRDTLRWYREQLERAERKGLELQAMAESLPGLPLQVCVAVDPASPDEGLFWRVDGDLHVFTAAVRRVGAAVGHGPCSTGARIEPRAPLGRPLTVLTATWEVAFNLPDRPVQQLALAPLVVEASILGLRLHPDAPAPFTNEPGRQPALHPAVAAVLDLLVEGKPAHAGAR